MFCFILRSNKDENGVLDQKINLIFKNEKYPCIKEVVVAHSPKIQSLLQNAQVHDVEIDFEPSHIPYSFEDFWHIFNLRQIFININNIDFLEEMAEYLEFKKLQKFCRKYREQYDAILQNPIFIKLEEIEEAIFSLRKINKIVINNNQVQNKTSNSDEKIEQNPSLISAHNSNLKLSNETETESSTTSQFFQFNQSDIISTDSAFFTNNQISEENDQNSNATEEEEDSEENEDFKNFIKIGFDHTYDVNIGHLIYEACNEKPHMTYTYICLIEFLNGRNYNVSTILSTLLKNSMERKSHVDIFIFRYLYEKGLLNYNQIPLRVKCSYYFCDKENEGSNNYSYDVEVRDYLLQVEKKERERMNLISENNDPNKAIQFLLNERGDWFRPFFENSMREGTNQSEAAVAIRADDDDELRKISGKQSFYTNDFANDFLPNDIFECSEKVRKIRYIDYAALHGAPKCFKYLMLIRGKITEGTFVCAIHGGNYEIIHIVFNAITDEKKYGKEPISAALKKALEEIVCCHSTELFEWLYNLRFVFLSIRNTCCTFAIFKNEPIDQKFFQCEKCVKEGKMKKNEGFCHFCGKNCHKCHKFHKDCLSERNIRCFCDCGAKNCSGCNISHLIAFNAENDSNINNNNEQVFVIGEGNNQNNDNNDQNNDNNGQNNNNNENNENVNNNDGDDDKKKNIFVKEIAIIDDFVCRAISKRSYSVLRFLVEQGVDFKNLNFGILTMVAKCNDIKLCEVLLKVKRIDITKDKDFNMKNAMYYANQNNNEEFSRLIHDAYFSLNDL